MSPAQAIGARLLIPILFISIIITGCDANNAADTPAGEINQNTGTVSGTGDEESTASDIRTIIKRVPDAENAFFTDSGRLFVSGGTNVYEVTGKDSVVPMFKEGAGQYLGIAQVGKWLYVVKIGFITPMPAIDLKEMLTAGNLVDKLTYLMENLADMVILRADLSAEDGLKFIVAHTFEDTMMPNGMAADADGSLYVADETILPGGKIVKVTITGEEHPVSTQETWIAGAEGCTSPNGIVIRDNMLYFTDFTILTGWKAMVKRVPIIDGRPGTVEVVHSGTGLSFFDDLEIGMYKGALTLAITDFFGNNIIMLDEATRKDWKVGNGKLQNPSSVHFGVGPLFTEKDIIITEKGMLMENYSSFGNRLSAITLP